MSDETNSAGEEPVAETTPAPKVRRISNKLPRKAAKKAAKPRKKTEVPIEEFTSNDVQPEEPSVESPPASEEAATTEEPKRPNRRRSRSSKGKSKPAEQEENAESDSQNHESPVNEETINLAPDSNEEKPNPQSQREGGRRKQNQDRNNRSERPEKQRRRVDPDKVAKNAWKIFLAEVSEEGVALIGDNDARELARRCFRLASIFLEEEDRRQ
ncbi:hypothetical protein [Luteolibacter sp. AS25]|uniref:hypothetical protein n=1 Tax=Luteolibacter sp. AS25 TaxID=3135776 RepID=UPI00398A6474